MDDEAEVVTYPARTTTNKPANDSKYGPTFTNPNQLLRLVAKPAGNSIRMKCNAKGNPEPTIIWTKDGIPIERKMGIVQFNKWAINLEDLIPEDSGLYTCKVCNIINCTEFTTKLEVAGKNLLRSFLFKRTVLTVFKRLTDDDHVCII